MAENKSKSIIIILIASILIIVLAIVPQFIALIDIEKGDLLLQFLMGFYIDIDNGTFNDAGFVNSNPLIMIGASTTLLMVLIGVFLLVTVIITMVSDIEIPFISLMWLVAGIMILLFPLFTRIGFLMVDIIRDVYLFDIFTYHLDLYTTLVPVIGLLVIIGSIIEITNQ
jgi:hypothetical protein